MSGFSRTQLRRENSCKKPLLEDTAGPVELLIVGVTILSFNSKALCGSSFSLWPFHSIMDIIFYIVRIKGNLAAHLFLQVIWEAKRSAGESRFFRKTEHISWHFWKGNNTTTDLKVSKNGTCKLYKKKMPVSTKLTGTWNKNYIKNLSQKVIYLSSHPKEAYIGKSENRSKITYSPEVKTELWRRNWVCVSRYSFQRKTAHH